MEKKIAEIDFDKKYKTKIYLDSINNHYKELTNNLSNQQPYIKIKSLFYLGFLSENST